MIEIQAISVYIRNTWDGQPGKNGRTINWRSLVEAKMLCFKLLGEWVMARDFDRQVAELAVRAAILNRFAQLDTPTTVRMG